MDTDGAKGGFKVTATVQKWGNSLAIRIPKEQAKKLGVEQGTEVTVEATDSELTIKPTHSVPPLDELVAKITPENRHEEIEFGTEGDELL